MIISDKNTAKNEAAFLSSFFSDETERFRSPSEPEPGQLVSIRLRVPNVPGISVQLLIGLRAMLSMREVEQLEYFSIFETELYCQDETVSYCFLISYQGRRYVYRRDGAHQLGENQMPDASQCFHFTPGFRTPGWAKGAVQYQILPDRFCNGDPTNDVVSGEYSYDNYHVRKVND